VQCGFLFTNPRPTKEIIHKYYQSDSYISHSNKTQSLKDLLYKAVRSIAVRQKVGLLNAIAVKRTMLDFGCGTGYFLAACQKDGWNVTGIEPDPDARKYASENTSAAIYPGIDDIPTDHKYQVISLWHVLEHVHDLNETLIKLKQHLEKTGRLVIAVPNISSYDARLYKEQWAAYDVPRHLYHFSQDTMKTLMDNHQLRIKRTIPMKYDAYYVSLMSEKSKNMVRNYIYGFINGYKSNTYAKNHNKNFSSLIYVVGQ
jgi:2-polyprenyl-3-methyl-5-hydroxy-6-metoxy-1,4-benzoquinol methylase